MKCAFSSFRQCREYRAQPARGSQIAFVRTFSNHSEVFLIPALGGARESAIYAAPIRGERFPVRRKRSPRIGADATDPSEGIFLIDVRTGAKRRKTSPPDSASDIAARFSPDGQTLALLRDFGASVEVFVVSAIDDGNARERQLTFDKTAIIGLTWNADGTKIPRRPPTRSTILNFTIFPISK